MHWPDNNIGAAGAEALAPALKEMAALEKLNLDGEFVIGWVVVSERIQRYTDTPRPPRMLGMCVGGCCAAGECGRVVICFLYPRMISPQEPHSE